MIQERTIRPVPGWFPLILSLGMLLAGPTLIVFIAIAADRSKSDPSIWPFGLAVLMILSAVVMLFGFMAVAPNDARVLLLFGEYKGSVTQSGFYWVNPFYSKKRITLRVRNFETGSTTTPETKDAAGKVLTHRTRSAGRPSKVNDRDGNPVDISAVVVWKVVNTAEAMFEVDDYEDFLAVQSEAALRILATRHPYDSEDHEVSLRGSTTEVCDQLKQDIQERLDTAGVQVIEARISHLAYAQEIAAAMLQRQQAQAVVAARTKIVEGAVGMVQMALDHLAKENVVELDPERRAAMVSNLLVVLCSDRHTQPVINTGTLHN
jgi:regulator of protease activity HflC (stomatin/prohibitin superfamily)